MNGKKVFDSLEGIEDEYILEAAPGQHKKRAGTLRIVALAAAAAILISAIPFGVWKAKRRKAAPSVTEDESYYAPYYEDEAYYVCGIINSPIVVKIIDGYAINTNRGIDVLRYIGIPQFDSQNTIHRSIASLSKQIHELVKEGKKYSKLEKQLSNSVKDLYCKRKTSKRKAGP